MMSVTLGPWIADYALAAEIGFAGGLPLLALGVLARLRCSQELRTESLSSTHKCSGVGIHTRGQSLPTLRIG